MLTYTNDNGTWGLKDMKMWQIPDVYMPIVIRLHEYEKIGLEPEQLKEIDQLYFEKCQELNKAMSLVNLTNNQLANLYQDIIAYSERKYDKEKVEYCKEMARRFCNMFADQEDVAETDGTKEL